METMVVFDTVWNPYYICHRLWRVISHSGLGTLCYAERTCRYPRQEGA